MNTNADRRPLPALAAVVLLPAWAMWLLAWAAPASTIDTGEYFRTGAQHGIGTAFTTLFVALMPVFGPYWLVAVGLTGCNLLVAVYGFRLVVRGRWAETSRERATFFAAALVASLPPVLLPENASLQVGYFMWAGGIWLMACAGLLTHSRLRLRPAPAWPPPEI